MLDPDLIRRSFEEVATKLSARGSIPLLGELQQLEARRRKVISELQDLQSRRNQVAKEIGERKRRGEDASTLLSKGGEIGDRVKTLERERDEVVAAFDGAMMRIPNIPHASVPHGKSEVDNVEVRRWGTPRSIENPRDHTTLGEQLGQIDFEAGARISGSRFVVLRGGVAALHRALAQFMLQLHTREHGYEELYVPYLVAARALEGTGNLPKFEEDLFKVPHGDGSLYLIPTAEVPATNLVREQIVSPDALPLKFVAHTPCFRSEAGSAGRDTRGMIRNHQFDKVEMVQITSPDRSWDAHEEMARHAGRVLELLELPYRQIVLCSGDLGFSMAKTYDFEVWLPSEGRYREISSVSNAEAFQARRMQARVKLASGKTEFVHTLNGSGVAVGRALVAVMENYQNADGSITVPEVLRPFMGGVSTISRQR